MSKTESIYPFCKFEENPPIFKELSWSFFILFVFYSKFHCKDLFVSNSFCCEWRPSAIKFGANCTCHHISLDVVKDSLLE
jgi:hypothetical protein